MFGNIYTPNIAFFIYFIIIFAVLSISLTISFRRHRSDWSKSGQYFTLFIILASGIIAITLIVIGYPYSDRVFEYNSIQSRRYMLVVIYGVISLLIGLAGFIILRVKESKKGKLTHS